MKRIFQALMIIVFVCAARVNVSRSETTIIAFDDPAVTVGSTEYSVDLDGDTQADVRFTTSVESGFQPGFPGCAWFSDIRLPALGGYYASATVGEHEVVVEFLTPVTDSLAFDFAVSGPISTSLVYIQVFDNDDPFRYAANSKEAVSYGPCGPEDDGWSEGSIEVLWSGWTADYAYVNFYTTGGGFTLDNFEVTPVVSDCNGDCDRDGNGEITPLDALCALEKFLGICPTSCGIACEDLCCDVNGDGQCTPADALEIFKEYLGMPSVCSP